MGDWADRVRLPGPTNFIHDVVEALEAGRSAVVMVPSHLVASGAADRVVDALNHGAHAVEVDPGLERSELVRSIEDRLGLDGHWRSGPDPWRDLVACPAWQGECVSVRGWDYDASTLVSRWSSLMSEQSHDTASRPRFLLVARREDLDEAELERIDLLHVGVHWWWGVIDRLDTEAALAERTSRSQRDPLRRSVIAEIAAWDLDFAEHLHRGWREGAEMAAATLGGYRDGDEVRLRILPGVPSTVPALKERDDWDAGLVEVWDGARRRMPWAVGETDVSTSIWRAQNRTFMPRLDERRADLEREFVRAASPTILRQVRNMDGVCELGPMRWASNNGVRLRPESVRALQVLTQFRNCLAHGRPADLRLLKQVQEHL